MTGRTNRARKRKKSIKNTVARVSRFTWIVVEQDGKCWFCGTAMGADCTREHLKAQCFGGTDTNPAGNLVAAHRECNSAVGHLPVADKHRLREIAHAEGRAEMISVAKQMRRADARMAFRQEGKVIRLVTRRGLTMMFNKEEDDA